jgi:hypothetical protein
MNDAIAVDAIAVMVAIIIAIAVADAQVDTPFAGADPYLR